MKSLGEEGWKGQWVKGREIIMTVAGAYDYSPT